MSATLVIVLVGSLVAISCALVGSFLVLRQMALMGDAISHAVLPGIVIAFLLTGDRAPLPMILGAGALGVVTVVLVELFHRSGRLKEDASIGVVFPALFSVGVLLVARYTYQVDLDLDCVLYGEIAYAPLDILFVGDTSLGPKGLWVNGGILLANLAFVLLFYKELKVTTFDPGLAATLGFSPMLLHYLLMSAVSVTVVGAFESVGVILVVAMLVVPPAAAYLLTDRLSVMLVLGCAFGVVAAALGYALALYWDASIAGAMATVTGAVFALAFLFSPRYGMLGRLLRHRRVGRAMSEQLVLLHLGHDSLGHQGGVVPLGELARRFDWPRSRLEAVSARLVRRRWVELSQGTLRLTPAGVAAIQESGQQMLLHPTRER